MNEHPIDPFLAVWSAASGIDGFASRLRVYQALRLPGPWTRTRLRAALASVLVLAPDQHDRFVETFDLWFSGDERDGEVEVQDLVAWLSELKSRVDMQGKIPRLLPPGQGPDLPVPRQPSPPSASRHGWRWGAAGVTIFLLFLILGWLLRPDCRPWPVTHDAGADAGETTEVNNGVTGDPEPPPPTEPWARYRLGFRFTDAPLPSWRRDLLGAALGLAVFCTLLELWLVWRRRRFLPMKAKPIFLSDAHAELELCTGPSPKPLSVAALDRIAFRTGLVPDFELPKLNPGKTARLTARNAGCFSPVHDPMAQTRGLSIIRPLRMDPVAEAVLACFASGLGGRAIPVRVLSGPPRWDTDDLVLVLVDGRFPQDPPVERWLTIPHLALVETRDVDTWGSEIAQLPRGVFPFDAKGLYAAIEVAATRRLPPRLQRTSRHDVLSWQSPAGLGYALPLAAACALISPFDLGTADELRRELLPDVPFLAFQRVLDLRGVMPDGNGWRMSSALACQLLERVGPSFVCRVLHWQERRLAALDPAPGSRARKMLEREQAMVRLPLRLLEGQGEHLSRPSQRDLLKIVQELEAHLGEPSLGRRVGERLLTLPPAWLSRPSVPEWAGRRVAHLRGDERKIFRGRDPRRRPKWLYMADAGTAVAAALLVWAAKPAPLAPSLMLDPGQDAGIWVVRANQVEKSTPKAIGFSYPAGEGPLRLVGIQAGSPAIQSELTLKQSGGKVELVREDGDVAQQWTCTQGSFDPGPGGPKRLVSIVSLPPDPVFDIPGRELLGQGIATCIVRENSPSLPIHADEVAQILRVETLADVPQPREEGYGIPPSGFWIKPRVQRNIDDSGPPSFPKTEPKLKKSKPPNLGSLPPSPSKNEPLSVYGRQVNDEGALDLSETKISDLSPLKGMSLSSVNLKNTKVSDLSPLKGMALSSVNLKNTKVSDLSPLKGMKLTSLGLSETRVSDLSPLKGMNLTSLDLSETKVSDLSSLKGMPLTSLGLSSTQVSDLSPLKGMQLTSLDLSFTQISDLSPLKGMQLTSLNLSSTQVSDLSPLKGMKLASLNLYGTQVSDLSPLKGMKLTSLGLYGTQVSDLSPLKGMNLASLDLYETQVSDLSPLKGMKLTFLDLTRTQVSNISALKGMKLTSLDLSRTQISDLSALKGMKLTSLGLFRTQVSDLSPLKGMKLPSLNLCETQVSDLSALKGMKLTYLNLSFTQVSDLSPLKGMNSLERLHLDGLLKKIKDWSPVPQATRIEPVPPSREAAPLSTTSSLPIPPSSKPSVDGGLK